MTDTVIPSNVNTSLSSLLSVNQTVQIAVFYSIRSLVYNQTFVGNSAVVVIGVVGLVVNAILFYALIFNKKGFLATTLLLLLYYYNSITTTPLLAYFFCHH